MALFVNCSLLLLQDANDERPLFAAPLYRASVSESADVGSIVALSPSELAHDADSGLNGEVWLSSLNAYLRLAVGVGGGLLSR